jgi:TonB-dependent SusC/RagA subfamily outer membrane receptor
MKPLSILLSFIFAGIGLGGILQAAPLTEPLDTLDHYIIDSKPVERFDGMLLEGRKIVSYKISTYNSAVDGTIRIHYIQTEGAPKPADPAYVIDGKQVSKRKFEQLNPSHIKRMTVIKNDSPEARKYEGWENGVILVETKEKDTKVNIGYGEADTRDLSYSVSSVKPQDNEVYTNMYDYLRGKVAGVVVKADNTIVIRGVTTMNSSTEPLILVDGVEITDLNLINPNDVYSVDILKDASASIYGLKGANGVILITTKRKAN